MSTDPDGRGHRRFGRWTVGVAILAAAALAWVLFVRKAPPSDHRSVLRVADQQGGIQSLLNAAGVLDNLPYRIEWTRFPSGPPEVEALNADAVDVGLLGDGSLIVARAGGVPIKAITSIRGAVTGTRLFVHPESGIRTIADLRGHSIGVLRGTALHLMTLNILRSAGLSERDVTLNFLSPADARAAFASGAIDAWASVDPQVAMEELSPNPPRPLVDGRPYMVDAIYVVATDHAIDRKHGELADFAARVKSAYDWSNTHPAEFAQMFFEQTKLPLAVCEIVVSRRKPWLADPDDALVRDLAAAIKVYQSAGVVDHPVDAAALFDRTFPITSLPLVSAHAPTPALR
jgi:sulfonate transport system substrate-binding protein